MQVCSANGLFMIDTTFLPLLLIIAKNFNCKLINIGSVNSDLHVNSNLTKSLVNAVDKTLLSVNEWIDRSMDMPRRKNIKSANRYSIVESDRNMPQTRNFDSGFFHSRLPPIPIAQLQLFSQENNSFHTPINCLVVWFWLFFSRRPPAYSYIGSVALALSMSSWLIHSSKKNRCYTKVILFKSPSNIEPISFSYNL